MTKDMDLNKNKKIALRNDAICGKQPMTLQEAKLLRLVIMQVSQYDNELMVYKITVKEVAQCLGIDDSNLYREIRDICRRLMKRNLEISTDNPKDPWKIYQWFSTAEYDGEGNITLELNSKIKPFVLEFRGLFTQYQMNDVFNINSMYSLRIYEILKKAYTSCLKVKHTFNFNIKELREMTDTENVLKTTGDFKRRVLSIAECEINKKTDMLVSFKDIKKSRQIIGFEFTVDDKKKIMELPKEKPQKPKNNNSPRQLDVDEISNIKALLEYNNISCSQSQAADLYRDYSSDIERFKRNLDYVIRKGANEPIAYLFSIKNKDIEKKPELKKPKSPKKEKQKKTEELSEERKQAYLDIEIDHAEDLWPELGESVEDI